MKKSLSLSNNTFTYETYWTNEVIPGNIVAFDTETNVVDFPHTPTLALAAASGGDNHNYLIHPSKIAEFICLHADKHWVFQNCPFDFWVIIKFLDINIYSNDLDLTKKARRAFFVAVEENRVHDTMFLDMLLRSARNDAFPVPRDLGVLAREYAGLAIDKDDPYRMRYAELIGKDWNTETVEEGFLEYAVADPIATYYAFINLYKKAKAFAKAKAIPAEVIRKYGPLSEAVQVKGAIALAKVSANGIHIDTSLRDVVYKGLKEKVDFLVQGFRSDPLYREIFKYDKKNPNELILTRHLMPSTNIKYLRTVMEKIAQEISKDEGKQIPIPRTEKKNEISTSAKDWADYAHRHPFLQRYTELVENIKLCQFFKSLQFEKIFPRYTYIVRSGRTSSYNPNLQNVPRSGGLRELFMASPGYLLLAIDYAFIELRTLAAVCESLFGYSVLGQIIRDKKDPHCYSAAELLGMSYEEFMELKKTDEKKYKKWRQSSKPVNFGVGGGLGAESLRNYAHMVYKVDFTPEEAKHFREKLIYQIYSEIGKYLQNDDAYILATNLGTSIKKIEDELGWNNGLEFAIIRAVMNIVKGQPFKKDGTPYDTEFVERVWQGLKKVNQNLDIKKDIEARAASEELYKNLFWSSVSTLTGRIRGRVSFCQARNTPFQALAADGAKLALWRLTEKGYKIVGFVHDEIILEIPEYRDSEGIAYAKVEDVEAVKKIMCEEMQRVTGNVPIDADYVVNKKWKKDGKIKIIENRIYPQ